MQVRHTLCACSAQGLLPAHRCRIKPRTIEMPERVVAKNLTSCPCQYCVIRLGAQALSGGIMLVLVGALDQNKGHSLRPGKFLQRGAKNRAVGVYAIDFKP